MRRDKRKENAEVGDEVQHGSSVGRANGKKHTREKGNTEVRPKAMPPLRRGSLGNFIV